MINEGKESKRYLNSLFLGNKVCCKLVKNFYLCKKNMMTPSKQLIFSIALLASFCVGFAQNVSQKLPSTNIIGTALSVNYDDNNPSTTVNTIANAFDGKLDTYFASYERSGTWVGLDLGVKYVITKVAYCPRLTLPGRLLLGVIEGANKPDFGDAIVLCMITETPPENMMTEQTVDCSRGCRYVRYVGPNNMRCNIAELEFWGYAGNGNDSKLYQTTNLPDVVIHTTNAVEITSKDDYVTGTVSIISENGTKILTDNLEIRGRGNASWNFPKKPYRMKLNNKTNVLGLPAKERNWALINNWGDKTLMRNILAFDLSRRFQMPYTPAIVPVNVYLNGEFKGCYQLCDQIEVATNRVEVQTMTVNDVTLPNLSGGYLIEIDAYAPSEPLWFNSQRGIPVRTKYPKNDEIVPAQFDYIRNHFNQMEAAVFSTNYKDPVNGYRKYIDTETFIRYFLIGEIVGNTDTFWSVNMYKKRNNDKLYVGPVWDCDLAYDNDRLAYPVNNLSNWLYVSRGRSAGSTRDMVSRLFTDFEFANQLKSIYAYYRNQKIITEEVLLDVVDHYANELDASQKLNFTRWDIMNVTVHENPRTWGSYAAEVENVRNYIKARIKWMDAILGYKPPKPDEPPKPTAADEIYFENATVRGYAGKIYIEGIVFSTLVEIFDVVGNKIFSKTIHDDTSIPLRNGIYMVRLSNQERNVQVVKCSLE